MRRIVVGGVLFASEVSEFACSSRLRRSAPDSQSGKQHPLDPDCKEPADPPRTAGGEGPSEVFCCSTAQKKLKHLKRREKDCNDAVPCSESWKQLLPQYMDYYQGLEKVLCRTTTTTTQSTTTTVTTVTTTKEEVTESTTAEETTAAPTTVKTTTAKPAFSCQESCLDIATDDKEKCATLCHKVEHELTSSCSSTQCSWIQIHSDAYCSQNFKQLSNTGSGTSADECERMVNSDSSCGNFMHHNEDMCVCVLAGHACDFKKSTRGNKVYAKAEDCKAGAKAEQESSSSDDKPSESTGDLSDDEFNKEQEKALEKEQQEHVEEEAANDEQDSSASEDQGDDAEEGDTKEEEKGESEQQEHEKEEEQQDAEQDESSE